MEQEIGNDIGDRLGFARSGRPVQDKAFPHIGSNDGFRLRAVGIYGEYMFRGLEIRGVRMFGQLQAFIGFILLAYKAPYNGMLQEEGHVLPYILPQDLGAEMEIGKEQQLIHFPAFVR